MNPSLIFAFLLGLTFQLHARTWTSSDGRTLEAEIVRGDDKTVTIRRGVQEFPLALEKVKER